MTTRFARLRAKAFARQQGLCIYCQHLMWQSDLEAFAARYGLTVKQARRYQSTPEHLTSRQDERAIIFVDASLQTPRRITGLRILAFRC